MSTIEEMVETFIQNASPPLPGKSGWESGLLAVIEKHVGPMLADAFRNGQAFEVDQRQPNAYMPRITPEMYAARILSALTATGRE